jgi:hypothetical protein
MLNVQHTYDVDVVGTERLVTESFTVLSLKIDNPSGMWLYVTEASKYVPANTLGWITNILPPSNTIHIQYIDAATAGTPSTVTGGPILVTTYGNVQLESNGIAYTAATATDVAALAADIQAVDATLAGIQTTLDGHTTQLNSLDAELDEIKVNTQALVNLSAGWVNITTPEPDDYAILADGYTSTWIYSLLIWNDSPDFTAYLGDDGGNLVDVGLPLLPKTGLAVMLTSGIGIYASVAVGDTPLPIRCLFGRIR